MKHAKKVAFIVGVSLIASVPFLLHAQQGGSASPSAQITMTAAAFEPGKGWTSAAASIPGLNQGITYITSSLLGSTSWAFGLDSNNSHNMAVSTGDGTWGPAIAIPTALDDAWQYGFLPAYPDTGSPTNGWLLGGSGVSYFNGTSFSAPTTFASATVLQFYSSQGEGWILVNQQSGIGVSTFDTTNATANSWSPLKPLPMPIMPNPSPSVNFSASAAQGMLYILGFQGDQASVMVINKANTIQTYPLPFSASQTPYGGMLFAYGNRVQVLLAVQDGPDARVYSYLSIDRGQHWTDNSNQLPPTFSPSSVFLTDFANGVVVIPITPSSAGQIKISHSIASLTSPNTSGTSTPGTFIDLKQANPLWLIYPPPSSGSVTDVWQLLSADGTQQCIGLNDNSFDCFDFTKGQWSQSQPIPAGMELRWFTMLYFLGNNQVVGTDNRYAYYYDGKDPWFYGLITNMATMLTSFSTAPMNGGPNAGLPTANSISPSPNALWAFGIP